MKTLLVNPITVLLILTERTIQRLIPQHIDNHEIMILKGMENETRLSEFEGPLNLPVDLRQIYKHGYGDDPLTGMKGPVDLLALDMAMARALNLVLRPSPIVKQPMPGFYVNPSGKLGFHTPDFKPTARPAQIMNKTRLLDLEEALDKNLRHPPTPTPSKLHKDYHKTGIDYHVNASSFDFTGQIDDAEIDFTTCDEFGREAYFHPEETTGILWLPFYVWSRSFYAQAIKHKFSIPTIRAVDEYTALYDRYLDHRINWEYPKLELNVDDKRMLLIAQDRTGSFLGIPHLEFPEELPENFVISPVKIRMKVIEPYLLMMYCEGPHIFIMAELGTEPKLAEEKISEAKAAGIKGIGVPLFRDVRAEEIRREQEAEVQRQLALIKKYTK